MAETIYLLCGAASLICAWLLLRGYRASGGRLLFWSGLCFVGLACNNILLVADRVVLPEVDLHVPRSWIAVAAMVVLLWGLVEEIK